MVARLDILSGIVPLMLSPLEEVKSTVKEASPWDVVLGVMRKLQEAVPGFGRVTEVSLSEIAVASPQEIMKPVSSA